ncbi:MAG: argininosuccinate lyase [Thermomicrobiales bacterium]|nr:MAG: argininosuccinate lyase [Thermomicrobiales bacterium]
MTRSVLPLEDRRRLWQHIAATVAAHLIMMHEVQLIDDRTQATLLAALDAVRGADPPAEPLAALVAQFDDRLDALTPAGVAGTQRVGRGVADVVAAIMRLDLRHQLLAFMTELDRLRETALVLAETHAVSLMPAFAGGQATQPTTLGHFLGGLIAPLARAATRLRAAFDEVNASPMGAGALASSGLGIDRERLTALLGFDSLIGNTFDAVAATDHLVSTAEAVAHVVTAGCRFIEEILAWLRMDPGSIRLADRWTSASPDLPHWRAPVGLQALLAHGRTIERDAATLRALAASVGYGPIAGWADQLAGASLSLFRDAGRFAGDLIQLLSGMEINRAAFAHRAGRAYTTSSDLADILMLEEQLDPGAARSIAALAIARVMQEGVEISALTPEIIDAAALVVLGRELKIEFETISRYLAPRRFIERRAATGAPSPASTRAWIAQERERLAADRRWREETASRLAAAVAHLEAAEREALDRAPSE